MLELHPLQPGQHENRQVRGGGVSPQGPQAVAAPFPKARTASWVIDVCTEKEAYERLNGGRRRCGDPCPGPGYGEVGDTELESPDGPWPYNHAGEALVSLAGVTHAQGTAS